MQGSLQFSGGLQADASFLSWQQLPSEPQLGDLGTSCCWKPDCHLLTYGSCLSKPFPWGFSCWLVNLALVAIKN